jgi:Holliday junction resolvase
MSNVSGGHNFEREIAKLFRDAGFDVIRGAASKGKLAGIDCDIIVSKKTPSNLYEVGVALMQMKRTKRRDKLSAAVKAAGKTS